MDDVQHIQKQDGRTNGGKNIFDFVHLFSSSEFSIILYGLHTLVSITGVVKHSDFEAEILKFM